MHVLKSIGTVVATLGHSTPATAVTASLSLLAIAVTLVTIDF